MGNRPSGDFSIERINNDGDYEPNNCKWVHKSEQVNNKRTSHKIAYSGENLTVSQWAKRAIVTAWTFKVRIQRGWSIQDALNLPSGSRKSK